MPFGEQSTERFSGTARGARSRSSARDASIDEILKSIRQIIDEEPLTMRDQAREPVVHATRPRPADKPARAREADDPLAPRPTHRRPARVLRPAADDDVLAELLVSPPQREVAEVAIAEPAPPAATVTVTEAAVASEPQTAPIVVEPAAVEAVPVSEAAAQPEAVPLPPSTMIEPAPAAAAVEPVAPIIETAAAEEIPAVAAASGGPIALEPQAGSNSAADALLQSLAAGLAASGFETLPAALVEPPPRSGGEAAASQPENAIDRQEPEIELAKPTPQQAAAAAVAEVAAANAAPASAATPAAVLAPMSAADQDARGQPAEPPEPAVPAAVLADGDALPSGRADVVALPPSLADGMDDAIAAMLRPLLREWLDAHLPRMVEKALKEELRERPIAALAAS